MRNQSSLRSMVDTLWECFAILAAVCRALFISAILGCEIALISTSTLPRRILQKHDAHTRRFIRSYLGSIQRSPRVIEFGATVEGGEDVPLTCTHVPCSRWQRRRADEPRTGTRAYHPAIHASQYCGSTQWYAVVYAKNNEIAI